jgi:anti-anti-sigma factor
MKIPEPFSVTETAPMPEIHCLEISGELDLAEVPALQAHFESALNDLREKNLLIDLANCEFIDSSGVACLAETWQRTEQSGRGRLAISGVTAQVERTFEVAGLTERLHVASDLAGGVAHLQSAAQAPPD